MALFTHSALPLALSQLSGLGAPRPICSALSMAPLLGPTPVFSDVKVGGGHLVSAVAPTKGCPGLMKPTVLGPALQDMLEWVS